MTTHKYTCYINKIRSYDLIVIGTYINVIPIIFKSHAVSYLRSTEMKTVYFMCVQKNVIVDTSMIVKGNIKIYLIHYFEFNQFNYNYLTLFFQNFNSSCNLGTT